jgi:hypothetical protein
MLHIYPSDFDVRLPDPESLRFSGPCKIANPSMKSREPNVNASANLRGLIATNGISVGFRGYVPI